MRNKFFSVVLGFSLFTGVSAWAQKVDPRLKPFAQGKTEKNKIKVVALMKKPKMRKAPARYKRKSVITYLRDRSAASIRAVRGELEKMGALKGDDVGKPRVHWMTNSLSVTVTPRGLKYLADTKAILKIYANRKMTREMPREPKGPKPKVEATGFPYNFKETRLAKLIVEQPKITGQGVLLGVIDTGIAPNHPGLKGRLKTFWDGETGKAGGEPYDLDMHGTHVAGIMSGGDREKILIGVAPRSKIIMAAALTDFDTMLESMEFMLDPDKNPNTKDWPRAINNSWNCNGADLELFYNAISAWEASGILPIFSAGNTGDEGDKTITHPKEHPAAMAVGNVGEGGELAFDSSRGPAEFKGQEMKKPDLAAPGEWINSTIPDTEYDLLSGTSMAAPHVTGTVALMLQVNPNLNPNQIRYILTNTAEPTTLNGDPAQKGHWNKGYGYGRLDIYAAVRKSIGFAENIKEGFGPGEKFGFLGGKEYQDRLAFESLANPTDDWTQVPDGLDADFLEPEEIWAD